MVWTNKGKIDRVTKKFLLYLDVCLCVRAITTPKIIDMIEHNKIDDNSTDDASYAVNEELNSALLAHTTGVTKIGQ